MSNQNCGNNCLSIPSTKERGSILVMAIIILSIMLILGLVLAGIVTRNLTSAVQSQKRTVALELADSGVRYVHNQMLNSVLGADWRPQRSPLKLEDGKTKDPDALYLRGPSSIGNDRGGPDGLGPYARISMPKGRALVRVRLAYLDADQTQNVFFKEQSMLKIPEKTRGYLLIESVGRSGFVRSNDPTTLLSRAVRVSGFGSSGQTQNFRDAFEELKEANHLLKTETKKVIGFVGVGLLDSVRFITNKFHSSRPAELGCELSSFGMHYGDKPVDIITVWGGEDRTGPLWSNADLKLFGDHKVYLSPERAESWSIAGSLEIAGRLKVAIPGSDGTFAKNSLDSDFRTFSGRIRDGVSGFDSHGYIRGISRKEPPSILRKQPKTNLNRYRLLSQFSGESVGTVAGPKVNIGAFGLGQGVYIDSPERGAALSSNPSLFGSSGSPLVYDWLNPGNESSQGWEGPFYSPIASVVYFQREGFEVIKDDRSHKPYWYNPKDKRTLLDSKVYFRLRKISRDGISRTYILSSILFPNLRYLKPNEISDRDFISLGQEFNGIIFCEGDVRVRGVIPTDIQISLVSMGTIYIDGSITKGVMDESGNMLTEESTSRLMLMAKDYVALNTTQFFAPPPGERGFHFSKIRGESSIEVDEPNIPFKIQAEFLLEDLGLDPSRWRGYNSYQCYSSSQVVYPSLYLFHSPSHVGKTYFHFDIKPERGTMFKRYLFESDKSVHKVDRPLKEVFPLRIRPDTSEPDAFSFQLGKQEETEIRFHFSAPGDRGPFCNYRMARPMISPYDIRIEAGIYAEEGSFFIIPGAWFNHHPKDTRENFEKQKQRFEARNSGSRGSGDRRALLERALQWRFDEFGHAPEIPFYQEPLNIRIQVVGSISENMPVPMNIQMEWLRKWGWMPVVIGASEKTAPREHVFEDAGLSSDRPFVPGILFKYDPSFSTCRTGSHRVIRQNEQGDILLPMPKLPVSPSLAYCSEVKL